MQLLVVFLSLFVNSSFATQSPETICGKDDRVPSSLKPIGRMMASATGASGCTGTLISKSCMISAGHCVPYLYLAQFQVPKSSADGKVNYPGALDQYEVDQIIGSRTEGTGKDWSVYKLKRNAFSGKAAGEVQGTYRVNTKPVLEVKSLVRITGYGAADKELNYTQQTATGEIAKINAGYFHHLVDTMGGNSGSAVILESTQEIVGIHTNGGCDVYSSNLGTSIAANPDLQQAIQQCLALDP